MTIFEASIGLYAWFSENDSFSMEANYQKLVENKEESPEKELEKKAAILCGIRDLEELGLVKATDVGKKKIWVLKKSFDSFDQTIKLSPDTCMSIAQIINGMSKVSSLGLEESDPKQISGEDVKNLVLICSTLIKLRTTPAE